MNAAQPTVLQASASATERKRIARAFGRSAPSYDRHAALQRQVADRLLTLVPADTQFAQVLDLGCGTGYCSARLRQRLPLASVLALDLALPMLNVAGEQLHAAGTAATKVQLLCADAEALPLQSGSVDLLVSNLALQWCSDPATVFAEIQRVLKPGALALLSTLGPSTLQELRAAWGAVDQRRHSNEFLPASRLQQAADVAGLQCHLTREVLVRHYDSLLALAHELKGLGANVVVNAQTTATTSPAAFKAAAAVFARQQQAAGIPVQWETYCLCLSKPAECKR